MNYRYYDISYNTANMKKIVAQHEEEYEDNKRINEVGTEQYQKEKVDKTLSHLEESIGIKVK